ncbi:hypothetical protein FNV43_RR22880 [Rhamnella rubrinervis]|uniref:Uncharacterized protein n=1 Tax=Rhamnella rubrinervis TaxID=2594499 RepID=A0A8K0DV51_9ROSA|nr:hypothetical protein FNV43_RR22880 [Rhamnella rubrinervis]
MDSGRNIMLGALVSMAVEDEVMESMVSSLVLDSTESNQKGEMLSVEDAAWVDSCLIKEYEIPDSNWNALTDTFLEILSSEPGLLDPSASASDGLSVESDIEMPTLSERAEADPFPGVEAETEVFPVTTLNDILPINEESEKKSENITIKEDVNEFQSLAFMGNPFLPSYSDEMKEPETIELGTYTSSSLYEIEPSTDDIFRVWDLDIPVEEDELVKQLNKALEESSPQSKPLSTLDDDSGAWKDLTEESIDDIIAGISVLSLKQNSS